MIAVPLVVEGVIIAARVGTAAWRAYRIYKAAQAAAEVVQSADEYMRQQQEASSSNASDIPSSSSGGSPFPQLPEDPEKDHEPQLNSQQKANLKRFLDKVPSNATEVKVKELPDGGRVFQVDSPSSHIPGSFARYEKQVDKFGNTLQYTKTTYAPNGNIVHVAPKFPAGPKIRPGE